jgi:hypothetical protein
MDYQCNDFTKNCVKKTGSVKEEETQPKKYSEAQKISVQRFKAEEYIFNLVSS